MSKLLFFFPAEKKIDFKADVQRPQKQVEHSVSSLSHPLYTCVAKCPSTGDSALVPKALAQVPRLQRETPGHVPGHCLALPSSSQEGSLTASCIITPTHEGVPRVLKLLK